MNLLESKNEQKKLIEKIKNSFSIDDIASLKNLFVKLKIMPPSKVKHSIRVATDVAEVKKDKKIIFAALFHDYVERGGNVDELPISEKSKLLVKLLTTIDDEYSDSENIPLSHMKDVLANIKDEKIKNKLIIIKLADRLDKFKNKKLSKKYIKKSKELIKFLVKNHSGNNKDIMKLKKQFKL